MKSSHFQEGQWRGGMRQLDGEIFAVIIYEDELKDRSIAISLRHPADLLDLATMASEMCLLLENDTPDVVQ